MKDIKIFEAKPYIITQLKSIVESKNSISNVLGYNYMTLEPEKRWRFSLCFHKNVKIIICNFQVYYDKDRDTYHTIEEAFRNSGGVVKDLNNLIDYLQQERYAEELKNVLLTVLKEQISPNIEKITDIWFEKTYSSGLNIVYRINFDINRLSEFTTKERCRLRDILILLNEYEDNEYSPFEFSYNTLVNFLKYNFKDLYAPFLYFC